MKSSVRSATLLAVEKATESHLPELGFGTPGAVSAITATSVSSPVASSAILYAAFSIHTVTAGSVVRISVLAVAGGVPGS